MKKKNIAYVFSIITLLLLSFHVSPALFAQTDYSGRGASTRLSIGLGLSPGISLPIGSLDDEDDPALGFAFRGGLNLSYPLSSSLRLLLNSGLDIRNLGVKEDSSLDARFYNAQYFFVQPGFSFSSLALSINIGIPMSGSEPVPGGGVDDTRDVETEQLQLMIEPRVSAGIILMDTESYWLGLEIGAGFPINSLYKDEFQRDENIDDGRTLVPNTTPFSAHLGLTFQFAIPGT